MIHIDLSTSKSKLDAPVEIAGTADFRMAEWHNAPCRELISELLVGQALSVSVRELLYLGSQVADGRVLE